MTNIRNTDGEKKLGVGDVINEGNPKQSPGNYGPFQLRISLYLIIVDANDPDEHELAVIQLGTIPPGLVPDNLSNHWMVEQVEKARHQYAREANVDVERVQQATPDQVMAHFISESNEAGLNYGHALRVIDKMRGDHPPKEWDELPPLN